MRCPRLSDLPPAPEGRSGWPWNEETPPLPADPGWPRITIVTPSRNHGRFLEQAIRSVLLQGYPDLEYIVLDGGSTDQSLEILEQYAPWLARWRSEKDGGQAAALQRGFAESSGELLGWINADDWYLPNALRQVGQRASSSAAGILAGSVCQVDEAAGLERVVAQRGLSLENMVRYWEARATLQQPGLFFRRELYDETEGIDPSLEYAMDLDLLCRMLAAGGTVEYLPETLAGFRVHPDSKTYRGRRQHALEVSRVSRRYWDRVNVRQRDHDRFLARRLVWLTASEVASGRFVSGATSLWHALRSFPGRTLEALFRGLVKGASSPPGA
jgi:glycosyltransferase involved in cell wall biosynthesis